MSYQAAQAAAQVLGSVFSGMAARSQVRAQNIIGRANAAASNLVRRGANEVAGAQGALARYIQSRNNQRALDAAGARQMAAGRTISRLRDAQTAATVQERLKASEDLGRLAAASAFSGVTGGTVEMIAGALATREALREDQAARAGDAKVFELDQVSRDELTQAVGSLDNRAILDNIDRTVDNYADTPVQGGLLMDIVGSGANLGAIYDYGKSALDSVNLPGQLAPLADQLYAPGSSTSPSRAAAEVYANSGAVEFFKNVRSMVPDYLIPGGP